MTSSDNQSPRLSIARTLLEDAALVVAGPREREYGDKTTNHDRIAALWSYWFNERGKPVEISAYDVAICMMLLKVARLMHSPGHADSHLDIAGYAACAHEIAASMSEGGDAL